MRRTDGSTPRHRSVFDARTALALSLAIPLALMNLAAPAVPAPAWQEFEDEVHPGSPGTPLAIALSPYHCSKCLDEGRIEGEPRELEMLRMPVSRLVELLELDRHWLAIETPHFRILCTLRGSSLKYNASRFARADLNRLKTIFPELKFGPDGVRMDEHQRAHMYHVRAERLYAHFSALIGNTEEFLGMPQRYEVYCFEEYSEHHSLCDKFIGASSDKGAVQWHFREDPRLLVTSMCASITESKFGRGDEIFGNHFMHNSVHNLVDGADNYYRETWAWLEEGFGHFYERRETTRYNNFCWAEGTPPSELYKPDWETLVLARLRKQKDGPFAQWCEKLRPGELTADEHAYSWSFVDWLIEFEPLRLARLMKHIDDYVQNPTCAQAIEATFGVSPNVLQQRWREHVLSEYGKR